MIFFITLFRYFTIVLFFTLHFFSFSQGMQTRERAHCARSVFPFIKKKKKKTPRGGTSHWWQRWDCRLDMEKFEQFKPDQDTIESLLDGFEARLLCHNIQFCEKKRNWCQALVGEAGRSIIKKLPRAATWDEVKRELCDVLGEADPKERAIEGLLQYKPKDKGLGEIAADIITKAARATDDVAMQAKLGLKAFLKAIPRKHWPRVEAQAFPICPGGPAGGQISSNDTRQ